jgi:hypothetical protein
MWKVNKSIHEIREDAEKNSLISLSANWWIMLYLPIKNCMLFMRKP